MSQICIDIIIFDMMNTDHRLVNRDDGNKMVNASKDKAGNQKIFDDSFFNEDFDASPKEKHNDEREKCRHVREVSQPGASPAPPLH